MFFNVFNVFYCFVKFFFNILYCFVVFWNVLKSFLMHCNAQCWRMNLSFQKLVGGAWILAILCCSPQLVIFNTSSTLGCSTGEMFERCQTNFPTWITPSQYIIYFSFANFFIPLIVLLFSNCFICRTIWASSSNM